MLQNITDGSTTLVGVNMRTYSVDSGDIGGSVVGYFTISSAKVFELQMNANASAATYGMGFATNLGTVEVYANVEIRKIG
jgi:hypothetical protein